MIKFISNVLRGLFSFFVVAFAIWALFDLFEKIRELVLLFKPMTDPRDKITLIIEQLVDFIFVYAGFLVVSGWWHELVVYKNDEDKKKKMRRRVLIGIIACFVAIILYGMVALSVNSMDV